MLLSSSSAMTSFIAVLSGAGANIGTAIRATLNARSVVWAWEKSWGDRRLVMRRGRLGDGGWGGDGEGTGRHGGWRR